MLKQALYNWLNKKSPLEGVADALNQTKNVLCAVYDSQLTGNATDGDHNLVDERGNAAELPAGAIITNVFAHVITAVTAAGAATVALKAASAGDLQAATAKASLTLNALVVGEPDGAVANFVRLSAKQTVKSTVATGPLLTGKIAYYIEYVLPIDA